MMDPKIMNKVVIDEVSGCWQWQGAKTTCGYPVIARGGNTNIRGHRYVYEWVYGKIPEGHVIRHKCDNPLCVNPEHLVSGTPADNVKDMDERERRFKKIDAVVVKAVLDLWETGQYKKIEISKLLNMDPRRVGDIVEGKRDHNGRILRR